MNLSLALMGRRSGIPRSGLIAYFRNIDGVWVDTIGLSFNDLYAQLPAEHQILYSADGVNPYNDAAIIVNIAASPYLNNGGELTGNATNDYAQYADGTDVLILKKAYKYFGEVYPVVPLHSATIKADGWTAVATIPNAVVGGTYSLGTDADPTVSMTVTSKSWTDAGVETTLNRTVYGKAALRKPYPNQLVKDEAVVGSDITCKIVLNDFIYAGETVGNITIAEGLHTDDGSGGSSAVSVAMSVNIVNNSAEPYPLPIATWINHDREWVTGQYHTVKLAVAHKHFRLGKMVQAVEFIATDESLNSTSVIATSMTKTSWQASGLSAPLFEGVLDFTELNQGEMVTIDAILFPFVGEAYQISDNGNTYPSKNLTTLTCLNDKTGGFGTAYAYVDAVGGGTPAVSTNPATASANPYATVSQAAAAILSFNVATFGRSNVSGGVIRLTAAIHTHGQFNQAVNEIPLLIEAADPDNKATTIYKDSGSYGACPKWLKIKDITLQQASNSFLFNNGYSGSQNSGIVFENCTFDLNGFTANYYWIYEVGGIWQINCDGDDCLQGSGQIDYGHSVGSTEGSIANTTYTAIGCKDLNATWSGGKDDAKGAFLGWSHIGTGDTQGNCINVTSVITADGLAMVGNVIEKRLDTGGPAVLIDSATSSADNVLDIANTTVGARHNILYNDGSNSVPIVKKWTDKFTICYSFNCKSDVFASDGTLTGNWSVRFRVGSSHRTTTHEQSTGVPSGPGAWSGEVTALGDVYALSADPLVTDWVNDQSTSGGNAGGGDYTPGPLTVLQQIPAGQTGFPFDQMGRVVPTDGTAYVGAVQLGP